MTKKVTKWGFKMAIKQQLKKIKKLYTENIIAMGVTSKAVGWKTEESQLIRFDKLATIIMDREMSITVNDYGCGYGALLKYFLEERHIQVSIYNGYDISPEMLAVASRELSFFKGQLNLLETSSIKTVADYSFVSGTFNVRFDADRKSWEDFIREKLYEMYKFSRIGFSFNLLTSYVDYEEPHLFEKSFVAP